MLILDEREIDACDYAVRARVHEGVLTISNYIALFDKLRASACPLTVTDADVTLFMDAFQREQSVRAALESFIRSKEGTT